MVSGIHITIFLCKHTVSYHLIRHARIHICHLLQFSRIVNKSIALPAAIFVSTFT